MAAAWQRRRQHRDGADIGGVVPESETLEQYFAGLPPISRDGGTAEEFNEHWEYWQHPRKCGDGWLEFRTHPQIAPSRPWPFWYHPERREYAFERPSSAGCESQVSHREEPPSLRNNSHVWNMTCSDLKELLRRTGGTGGGQVSSEDLARRAIEEYERWLPRVQSWHDYVDHTFWFYGHDPEKGFTRESFADEAFYQALARLVVPRLKWMHPISISYMTWTFSRPEVVIPEFLESIGNFLAEGCLPLMDRCALCTMVWCFWKMRTPHQRFLEAAATEIKRPMRMRSLAPRNFQNSLIGYSRMRYHDPELVDRLAQGTQRLLDAHEPNMPKTKTHVLFSYTCLNGHEVPADAFRINGLTVLVRCFEEYRACGPHVERCLASMANYVQRSMAVSPPMMRTPGDAADFVAALGQITERLVHLRYLMDPFLFELPSVMSGAPRRSLEGLQRGIESAGIDFCIL